MGDNTRHNPPHNILVVMLHCLAMALETDFPIYYFNSCYRLFVNFKRCIYGLWTYMTFWAPTSHPCLATVLETYFPIYCYIEIFCNQLLQFLMDLSEILHNIYMGGENMHVAFERHFGHLLLGNDLGNGFSIYNYMISLCNQLILQFLMDRYEILHNVYMSSEDIHVTFWAPAIHACLTTALETGFLIYYCIETLNIQLFF